ncbi:MAG: hypothetical protein WDN76_04725 [Alphaproteobacteria bacterium]
MLGGDPVDRRFQILLDALDELAREILEIVKLLAMLGGEDDPEMMPIIFAAFDKGRAIGAVVLGVEHHNPVAVTARAVALHIQRMAHETAGAAAAAHLRVHYRFDLHDHALTCGRTYRRKLHSAGAAGAIVPGRARLCIGALFCGDGTSGNSAGPRPGAPRALPILPSNVSSSWIKFIGRASF